MLRLIIVTFCILFVNKSFSEINLSDVELNSYWCKETYSKVMSQQYKQMLLELEIQRLNKLVTMKLDTIQNILEHQQIQTSSNVNVLKRPKSCTEALEINNEAEGVFQIFMPDTGLEPFFAYCLKNEETNEAWMIIQRRINGKIDFYRDWHDYKYGFGDIFEEYWLGLEKLHILTNSRPHKLWIKLQDFDNMTSSENYKLFAIGNETTKYELNVVGEYSGEAGDSLRYHAGQKFSTHDNKNDPSENCAITQHGAWWFKNYCQYSHLNGEYYPEGQHENVKDGLGINWFSWNGDEYSLKYAHMAIAPINTDN